MRFRPFCAINTKTQQTVLARMSKPQRKIHRYVRAEASGCVRFYTVCIIKSDIYTALHHQVKIIRYIALVFKSKTNGAEKGYVRPDRLFHGSGCTIWEQFRRYATNQVSAKTLVVVESKTKEETTGYISLTRLHVGHVKAISYQVHAKGNNQQMRRSSSKTERKMQRYVLSEASGCNRF